MKPSQLALFEAAAKAHGGATRTGRRKTRRPLDPRRPLHLVLRSSHATGPRSFLRVKHEKTIATLVRQEARRSGVKLRNFVNVGNHLHLIVVPVNRAHFQRFLRVIAGRIARLVTGAERGSPFGKFWDGLAFTRVLEWGRDLRNAVAYLVKNEIEALGWFDLLPHETKRTAQATSPPSRLAPRP